jgi:putative hydrolase of the HAD superfamily
MNIIFDLGGVVLNWEPKKLLLDFFPDEVYREKIKTELLMHRDWADLDRGTLNFEEAIDRANKRIGIPKAEVRRLLNEILERLTIKQDTMELINELKKDEHKLYVLSNLPYETAEYLEKRYSFWDIFDGIVFSGRVNLIKPSPEIYQYILKKFNLAPKETVFFDDLKDNIDAAVQEGINGIHFISADQARIELNKLIEI